MEIVKHINDTNASYRTPGAGDAKNTDLFLDNEHYDMFKACGGQAEIRFNKENLSKAILFIASLLPRKFDHNSSHLDVHYSKDFVEDQLAILDAFFTINGVSVESRTQIWNIRKDVPKKNGAIDHRFYFNGLLEDVTYIDSAGKSQTIKFSIRNYLAGGYSDIHIKDNPNGVFDFWVTNAITPALDNKCSQSYLDLESRNNIYFGAPGTGKSFTLDKETAGLDVIRTTFHPDSDYSSFVGVYKPVEITMPKKQTIWDFSTRQALELPVVDSATGKEVLETKISYRFIKQAFLNAYIAAWKKKSVAVSAANAVKASTVPPSTGTSPYSATGFAALEKFDYTSVNAALSNVEQGLLSKVDAFLFPFAGTGRLKNLHDTITVEVKDKPDKNREKITVVMESSRIDDEGWLPSPDGKLASIVLQPDLLGEYVAEEKKVFLYKDNINAESNPTFALIDTYIHEMFHAIFDCGAFIPEIDEAIVECCTLCVLELLDKDNSFKGVLGYNIKKKEQKKLSAPNYGFGVFLYEHRSLDWMSLFMNGKAGIDQKDSRVIKYISLFHKNWVNSEKKPINAWTYPWDQEEDALELLYSILTNSPVQICQANDEILLIEEINRGNCAQIFGDIFQLLDRNDYGYSRYPISPDDDLRRCLKDEFDGIIIPAYIDTMFNEPVADRIKSGDLLVIPDNMYIFATMNTSDQSLFPMDSAFKRRWSWRYFSIKDEKKGYRILLSDGTEYDWWKTIEALNAKILATTKSADKQLGYWFAKVREGETDISGETFVSKVIFYLWNDIFKDYSFGDNNPFTVDITFDKFYDKDGNVIENTVKDFMLRNYPAPQTP